MKYSYALLFLLLGITTDFYSYTVNAVDGSSINLSDFRGKKILIVNISTGGERIGQLAELQQLQQTYLDSLVVIGFPSNSFHTETRSNLEIKEFCRMYGANFLLAAKGSVRGEDIQPVYQWLTLQSQNGEINSDVQGDYQKYLINNDGTLQGVFRGSMSPLSDQLVSLITGASN